MTRRPSRAALGSEILFCHICDSEDRRGDEVLSGKPCPRYDSLRRALTSILSQLSRASGPRIAAVIAMRRLLLHDPDSSHMQIASSAFGEFCLNSLRSSVRELRVVTGYEIHLHISLSPFAVLLLSSRRGQEKKKKIKRRLTSSPFRRSVIAAFVRKISKPEIRQSNFVVVLEWLRGLSEKGDVPLQETCILALFQLARYVLFSQASR